MGMHEYLVEEELENYRFGWISRREFIRRAALIGVSATAAAAMAGGVTVRPVPSARGAQLSPFHVPENDARVRSDTIWYRSTDGTLIQAYVAWPAGAGMDRSNPGVAVTHENQGLIPHIMDVARRFAVQGYVAIAPDLITRVGPPASTLAEADRRAAYASLDSEQSARDLVAAVDVLKAHPAVNPTKLAATGYCAGGAVTWRLATLSADIKAAAPFYGTSPSAEALANIRAAMFGVYGELDERVNAGIPDVEAALQSAGVTYAIKIYPNSLHGFHRDDGGNAYNPETAREAWIDTLNWFAEHLELPAPRV